MSFVKVPDPRQSYRYVLHARHGRYEEPQASLKMLMGENYDEYMEEATQALHL